MMSPVAMYLNYVVATRVIIISRGIRSHPLLVNVYGNKTDLFCFLLFSRKLVVDGRSEKNEQSISQIII